MGGCCGSKSADDVVITSRNSDGFARTPRPAADSIDATVTNLAPADGKINLHIISPREMRDEHGIHSPENSAPSISDSRGSVTKRGSYLETLEWVQDVLDDGQMETKAQMGAYAKKVSSEL